MTDREPLSIAELLVRLLARDDITRAKLIVIDPPHLLAKSAQGRVVRGDRKTGPNICSASMRSTKTS
ncbi:hypothetical protein KBY23_06810 [Ruegeria pomeroyi]|nr:hypothetical protein [Ruegeria pomeroyi]